MATLDTFIAKEAMAGITSSNWFTCVLHYTKEDLLLLSKRNRLPTITFVGLLQSTNPSMWQHHCCCSRYVINYETERWISFLETFDRFCFANCLKK